MCIHMSVTSLIILPQNRIKKIKNAYTGANDIIAGSKCPRNNPNSILVPGPPAVNQIRIRGLQNHYCNICSMANIAALRKCNGIMSTSDFGSSRQKNLLTPLAAWPQTYVPPWFTLSIARYSTSSKSTQGVPQPSLEKQRIIAMQDVL